jgi:radical SAM protein with 4Fe4S-binding SPASM domain
MSSNKYSIHKIAWFPEKLESFRQGTVTAPIYVRVKPTNRCNHDCFFCVYKASFSGMHELAPDRETDYKGAVAELTTDKLLEILDDFHVMGVKAVTYSGGGEPLMHNSIVKVMERTLELGIDLSIITNGQLLMGERAEALARAKWVRVSVDYQNAEQMAKHRNVPPRMFEALLTNLSNFARLKSPTCNLFINYIVHKGNCLGLLEAVHLFKAYGAENIRFSPMWLPDMRAYHAPIKGLVEEQLKAAQAVCDDKFSVNTTYDLTSSAHSTQRGYHKCLFMQIVPVIAADGNVYACHNKAYDAKGMVGSLAHQRFDELWFSAETKHFFETLDPAVACCHQCANDEKNILMHDILSAHDNFI